jgi:hypothetical protein
MHYIRNSSVHDLVDACCLDDIHSIVVDFVVGMMVKYVNFVEDVAEDVEHDLFGSV